MEPVIISITFIAIYNRIPSVDNITDAILVKFFRF